MKKKKQECPICYEKQVLIKKTCPTCESEMSMCAGCWEAHEEDEAIREDERNEMHKNLGWEDVNNGAGLE